jgi:HPt (histidine-containing phosphotransfer) domain-containing protein
LIGHSVKGSGGGYGFDAISEIGFQIEQAALNEDRERIADEIEKLAAYLEPMEIIFQ